MPNQPSKESLKLATAFFIGYFGNNAENHHPLGIGTLAFVFDAEAKDLRQKNSALVSALREIDEWLYRIRGMCFSGAKSPNQMREELQKILALYAPAEAEAKEKP